MDKDARFIKPTMGNATPGLIVVLDTESLPEYIGENGVGIHKLRLGVAIAWRVEKGQVTRRRVFRFSTADEFWNWLFPRLKVRQPTWLFAHNLGFDLTIAGFWERIESGEYGFSRDGVGLERRTDVKGTGRDWYGFLCAEDPPTIVNVMHKTGGRLVMLDTLNYFRCPLSQLGDSCGLPKGDMPDWSADDATWYDYCERDAEILEATVCNLLHWWKENGLGSFKYTTAGLAMEAYRRRFQPKWIELHDNESARVLERESYYGGRLELFYTGKVTGSELITELDVNSLYPAMMRAYRYPFALADSDHTGKGLDVDALTVDHIARVKVRTFSDGFPYRCRLGLLFPTGEYETTLAGPELMRAVRSGCVLEVGDWNRYKTAYLFRDFVDHFYENRIKCRESGDKIHELFCKLVLNSLYGKFGQRYGKWQTIPDLMPMQSWGEWYQYEQDTNTIRQYRGIGHMTQVSGDRGEHNRAFPAISSYVTSYAREFMRELIHCAGIGHVYYTVTDSLFVDQFGLDNLQAAGVITDTRLGGLKIKHQARTAVFDAPHWWRLGKKQKRGNLKPSATMLSETRYEFERFSGLKDAMRRAISSTVHVKRQVISFDRSNRRGIVGVDGWVTPLAMDCNPVNDDWVRKPVAG